MYGKHLQLLCPQGKFLFSMSIQHLLFLWVSFKPYSSTVCAAGTSCMRAVTSDYVTGSRRTSLDCSAHSCKICACGVSFEGRQTDSSCSHDVQGSSLSGDEEGSSAECRHDCNRKSCGVPVAIDNADHTPVNPAMLEETFTYKCHSGHSLEGSPVGDKKLHDNVWYYDKWTRGSVSHTWQQFADHT